MDFEKHPEALARIKDIKLPTDIPGFGILKAPIMFEADFHNGEWGPLKMVPYGPIPLDPDTKVFHYGQEIFEGLKAYRKPGENPSLYRPIENWKRFVHSAKRMAMAEIPKDYFMTAVEAIAYYCKEMTPTNSGESLYIRPFQFATERNLGIKPSTEFKFLVIASPVASYFKDTNVSVLVERKYIRAVDGGVGNAKTGGNYAASLRSSIEALRRGHSQVLWLDARERKFVEEMSGMNFMCVIDGTIVTPFLTESILAGITRKSLLELAPYLGYPIREERVEISDLLQRIRAGECDEAFACGTAAIITPIKAICEVDGSRFELKKPNGDISMKLRKHLLGIQERDLDDPFRWTYQVPEF